MTLTYFLAGIVVIGIVGLVVIDHGRDKCFQVLMRHHRETIDFCSNIIETHVANSNEQSRCRYELNEHIRRQTNELVRLFNAKGRS